MTYKLSNYLLVDDYFEENQYSNFRLISLSSLKRSKIGNTVKDYYFTVSIYDIENNLQLIRNRLLNEEKIKNKDVEEIIKFILDYEKLNSKEKE